MLQNIDLLKEKFIEKINEINDKDSLEKLRVESLSFISFIFSINFSFKRSIY